MSGGLALVYPVLAQVLLTLVVLIRLGATRAAAFRSRAVRVRDMKSTDADWPAPAARASANFRNQFETPVLFYVLCGAATYLGATGFAMALFAWLYVASRVAHALIHTTYNKVEHRFSVFLVGILALVVMWVLVTARLLGA